MLGSTLLLSLAILAGLLAGFGREWLLVAGWGAGHQTDAFLVALFLPEAVRTMLAGGLLSSALLPLWQETPAPRRAEWLAAQTRVWFALGVLLALAWAVLSPLVIQAVGPGLSTADHAQASQTLACLAWGTPFLLLQAVLTVPYQAKGRFLLPGLGSLLFNLPAVLYLGLMGERADATQLATAMVGGSIVMAVVLIPGAWEEGWRPWLRTHDAAAPTVWKRLWPLLLSSGASQGMILLERLVGSFLGEGSITMLNLARKLVGIPLIGLMSLNQVLLGKMSGEQESERASTLLRGLSLCTVLTLPAVAGIIASAPALVAWLLPGALNQGPLPGLLAVFALSILFGSWNALLARYNYANGDTRTPTRCELLGDVAQVIGLFALVGWLGLWGVAGAVMLGVLVTALLLSWRIDPGLTWRLGRWAAFSLTCCVLAALLLHFGQGFSNGMRFSLAALYGALLLAVLGWHHLIAERTHAGPTS